MGLHFRSRPALFKRLPLVLSSSLGPYHFRVQFPFRLLRKSLGALHDTDLAHPFFPASVDRIGREVVFLPTVFQPVLHAFSVSYLLLPVSLPRRMSSFELIINRVPGDSFDGVLCFFSLYDGVFVPGVS